MLPHRQFRITDVRAVEDLIKQLTFESGQTLCQGYLHNGLLWLNTSLTSDPGRYWEYAVLIPQEVPDRETVGYVTAYIIDSVTVSGWGYWPSFIGLVEQVYINAGAWEFKGQQAMRPYLDRTSDHVCPNCE